MRADIAEVLTKQGEIIRCQSTIIDSLALNLLQYAQIDEATLDLIKEAVQAQKDMKRKAGEGWT